MSTIYFASDYIYAWVSTSNEDDCLVFSIEIRSFMTSLHPWWWKKNTLLKCNFWPPPPSSPLRGTLTLLVSHQTCPSLSNPRLRHIWIRTHNNSRSLRRRKMDWINVLVPTCCSHISNIFIPNSRGSYFVGYGILQVLFKFEGPFMEKRTWNELA